MADYLFFKSECFDEYVGENTIEFIIIDINPGRSPTSAVRKDNQISLRHLLSRHMGAITQHVYSPFGVGASSPYLFAALDEVIHI